MQVKKTFNHTHQATAALLSLFTAMAGHAVENGAIITPPGIYDFGTGMTPPPSDVGAFAVRAVNISSNKLRDDAGNVSPVKPTLRIHGVTLAGLKATDVDFLGGKYAFGFAIPVLDGSLDLAIPTPVGTFVQKGSNTAVGDVQIAPVIVSWKPAPGVFTNAGLMIQLPTGSYDQHRTFNAGTNHWTIQPNFQFTWLTQGGLEFSGSSQFNFNTRNHTTDYRSGIEWQQDFGIGQHVGDWTFGLAGYVYRQLSDDKGLNVVNGNRSRVNALGPAIAFFGPKHNLPVVYLHWYKEFGARNRTEGSQAAIRVEMTF